MPLMINGRLHEQLFFFSPLSLLTRFQLSLFPNTRLTKERYHVFHALFQDARVTDLHNDDSVSCPSRRSRKEDLCMLLSLWIISQYLIKPDHWNLFQHRLRPSFSWFRIFFFRLNECDAETLMMSRMSLANGAAVAAGKDFGCRFLRGSKQPASRKQQR